MAQDFAKKLYNSRTWRKCRESYIASVHGLCEKCSAAGRITPGKIVHHKIHITPSNVNDPNITLNHDNLMLMCVDHHNAHHMGKDIVREGLTFNENGELVQEG